MGSFAAAGVRSGGATNTCLVTSSRSIPAPAAELLRRRELRALKILTAARAAFVVLMLPLVWVVGLATVDRMATSVALVVYFVVVLASVVALRSGRPLTWVGLTGVGLDVAMMALLPAIWFQALGGAAVPPSVLLKTSVTLISLLLITLNALAMRPLYPALAATGALAVHLALLFLALVDERTVFTEAYLEAYISAALASGRVVTQFVAIVVVGALLTILAAATRRMLIEAVELEKANVQLGRYFSPNLVSRLVESPSLLDVGGERRELSFVFTDLAGFTSLIERADPAYRRAGAQRIP